MIGQTALEMLNVIHKAEITVTIHEPLSHLLCKLAKLRWSLSNVLLNDEVPNCLPESYRTLAKTQRKCVVHCTYIQVLLAAVICYYCNVCMTGGDMWIVETFWARSKKPLTYFGNGVSLLRNRLCKRIFIFPVIMSNFDHQCIEGSCYLWHCAKVMSK